MNDFECPRCGHCCQALEEKREPLYWSVADGWVCADDTSQERVDEKAKREHEWIGLSAEEIQEIHLKEPHWGNFACAIEAKLREKNHG